MEEDCKTLSVPAVLRERAREWQNWGELKRAGLFPLLIVVVVFSAATNYYVGDYSLDLLSWMRWLGIGVIVLLFILALFILDLFASFIELRNYKDEETGNIDVSALWKKVFTNPLNGIILIGIMTFGITSAQDLSEYYRVNVTTWHDAELWALESPFFDLLKGSLIDIPKFWDAIYFSYWLYLILVYSTLYRLRRLDDLAITVIATVLSFFLTRWVALQFPTAGPAFYLPEYFDLVGTVSADMQKGLVLYMQGAVPQNGFIPGTMGMPSLHIGLTFMAAYFLVRNVSWTLWLSVIWICLLWLSTVMLGWHYTLDGVGGILIAVVAVLAAIGMLKMTGKNRKIALLEII